MKNLFLYFIFFLFFLISFSAGAWPRLEPKKFENCISLRRYNGFLIIEIKTNYDPKNYSVHEVYLLREIASKDQVFNRSRIVTSVENNLFQIKINESLIGDEDYSIRVMLYDEKRGRQEFYIS
jgi:hypothetical protein